MHSLRLCDPWERIKLIRLVRVVGILRLLNFLRPIRFVGLMRPIIFRNRLPFSDETQFNTCNMKKPPVKFGGYSGKA